MRRLLILCMLLCLASQAGATTYLSRQNGNLTDPNSWLQICTATDCELDSEAANTALTTSGYSYSNTTIPPAVEIGAVAVKVASRAASPSGTITVQLYNNTAGTEAFAVTINVSDINAANASAAGWYVFKTTSPVTPNGTDAYKIGAKTSVASMVNLYSSTATNWSRMLRLTAAAAAAPTTNDKLMIGGGCTAAATCTTHTITMNETATTSYGPVVSGGPPQGMTINNYGVLTYGTSASTNYYMKVKGVLRVYGGGTLNIGASGAQMPSTSTATLEMDSAANVDSGLYIDNGATMNVYGATKTNVWQLLTSDVGGFVNTSGTAVTAITSQCQSFTGMTGTVTINGSSYTISSVTDATHLVLTGSAGTQSKVKFTHPGTANVIHVADTSGWAAGDTLAIAPTSQTYTESESFTIASVDSGTQVTLSSPLIYTHQGMPPATGPIAAEVLNLTRNVQIRGVSATLQGYVYVAPTATVTWRYADFNQLGSATANKRGIDVATTTGSFNMQYCSRRDSTVSGSCGIFLNSSSNNNIVYAHSVSYNVDDLHIYARSTTGNSLLYNDLIMVKNSAADHSIAIFYDLGSTITNVRVAGGIRGMTVYERTALNGALGWTSHSNLAYGLQMQGMTGSVSNVILYRTGTTQLYLLTVSSLTLDSFVVAGGLNTQINPADTGEAVRIVNSTVACDSASTCTHLMYPDTYNATLAIENSSLGATSGIYTAVASNVLYAPYVQMRVRLLNTMVQTSGTMFNLTMINPLSYIRAQRYNATDGDHRAWYPYGTVNGSTTPIAGHTQPYELMTPSGTTSAQKLESSEKCAPVDASGTATFTAYIYKSAEYTGSQPRMVLKAKDLQVVSTDTVLTTASGGTGAWETLTGTTPAASYAGIACVVIDADNVGGGGGTVAVDDFSVQ